MMWFYLVLVTAPMLVTCNELGEGDSCTKDGYEGLCKYLENCSVALSDLESGKNPQLCSFVGLRPLVCCLGDTQTTSTTLRPQTAKPQATMSTTTEYIPPEQEYEYLTDPAACEMISPNRTAPKTGQKAWDKCIEYQEKLIFPCDKTYSLSGELGRINNCHHQADELIVAGEDAGLGEFPHMVLLGYEFDNTKIWSCGGSIISENFVLTAGHCGFSKDYGHVTYIAVGTLKRTDIQPSAIYKVKRFIKHPDYKGKYNDIALVETEPKMKLDEYAVPACLDIEGSHESAWATGWGLLEDRGEQSDTLQKVNLTRFTDQECVETFPKERKLKNGVDIKTQVCFGDYNGKKDSCQGDSGGPLQVKNKRIYCMYTIVGVTSFGKSCGHAKTPGLYTRVSAYIPWIESVVWP